MDKVLIKDIAEVVNGSTPSTKENSYWDGTIPWITPKDLSAFSGRYISSGERNITKEGYQSCSTTLVPKNTILLTSRAPIGYLAIAKNDLCTNQGFKSLICNQSRILPLYMFYWLSTKIEFLKSISGGATFKELSKTSLENVVMDLPNIVQQQHIVDTIGSVDDLIEIEQLKADKLNSFGQSYYDEFFAKNELIKPGKEIKFIKGKQPMFDDGCDAEPYLTIDALSSGNISQRATSGIKCTKNNLLMVMDGASSGKLFLGCDGYVGSTLAIVSCPKIETPILYFGLKKFQNEIMSHTTGSAIPHADRNYVGEMLFANITLESQSLLFNRIIQTLSNYRERIRLLKKLKNTLLRKYFQ